MSGRPDYDAGDLVVMVTESVTGRGRKGSVYTAVALCPPQFPGDIWGVRLKEHPPLGPNCWWDAGQFCRIDPKPPEFWTGEVEANQRDKVPA